MKTNFHNATCPKDKEDKVEAPQLEFILPKRSSLVIIIVASTLLQASTGNLAVLVKYSMSNSCHSLLSSHRLMIIHNILEEIRLFLD